MQYLSAIWIFYRKLILPSLSVSILLSLFMMDLPMLVSGVGIAYIFIAPVYHYFTYDFTNPHQYYFYYNLGFSKIHLWLISIIINLVIGTFLIRV